MAAEMSPGHEPMVRRVGDVQERQAGSGRHAHGQGAGSTPSLRSSTIATTSVERLPSGTSWAGIVGRFFGRDERVVFQEMQASRPGVPLDRLAPDAGDEMDVMERVWSLFPGVS